MNDDPNSDDLIQQIAQGTETHPQDWDYIDGPDAGHDEGFWLRNDKESMEVYATMNGHGDYDWEVSDPDGAFAP